MATVRALPRIEWPLIYALIYRRASEGAFGDQQVRGPVACHRGETPAESLREGSVGSEFPAEHGRRGLSGILAPGSGRADAEVHATHRRPTVVSGGSRRLGECVCEAVLHGFVGAPDVELACGVWGGVSELVLHDYLGYACGGCE